MSIELAAFAPGLPHLLSDRSSAWINLKKAYENLGKKISQSKPDVLVIYSAQWLSVLGTSFQTHPHPKGLHVDENWYELGDLSFDFKVDVDLSAQFAKYVSQMGFPTKTVSYDFFPIDTATLVAQKFLGDIPVSLVSSWVYADALKTKRIGQAMKECLLSSSKKAVVIALSSLSTRFFTEEIDPEKDHISQPEDETWNKTLLKTWQTSQWDKATELIQQAKIPLEMQGNAYHWLSAFLEKDFKTTIHGYGPLWGTGNAICHFEP